MSGIQPTPGYRMNVLIRRRLQATREELVANWFANHMPAVVKGMAASALAGKPHAYRYIATLFDEPTNEGDDRRPVWDGIAQLWWQINLPKPTTPHGSTPADTFQQKAEPYMPWMVREFVVMDGALPVTPNTLNEPFPFTRSGFFKVTYLLKTKPGTDHDAFFAHWLNVHAPNVVELMNEVGGFRYVIGQSVEAKSEDYAAHAELYFPNRDAWARFQKEVKADGMDQWADPASLVFTSRTEMVGIPG